MQDTNAFDNKLIQQIRGIVKDETKAQPDVGVVDGLGLDTINVRLSASGTLLRNVSVIGGLSGLFAGVTVHLMYFQDGTVSALNPTYVSGGEVSGPGSAHTHDDRYFTEAETQTLLSRKADLGHSHTPKYLEVEAGTIGAWTIDSQGIEAAHARLDVMGFLGFGDTIPLYYGNLPGVWLGIDTTDLLAKMSLYADATHYLQFDGEDVLLSGTIYAQAGEFQGEVQVGTGSPHILIDGVNALIKSSNFLAGLSGWQIDKNGDAEFSNITARGSIRTTVFEKSLVTAFAGSQIISKSASVLAADFTITAGTISTSLTVKKQAGGAPFVSGDRLRLSNGTTTYWIAPSATGSASVDNWVWTSGQLTVLNGSGTITYTEGDTVVDFGGSGGHGYLFLTADATNSPYIAVNTHAGSPWSSALGRARLGNLNGVLGLSADEWGLAVGTDLSDSTLDSPHIIVSNSRIRIRNVPFELYDSSNLLRASIDTSGRLKLGKDLTSATKDVALAVFTVAETFNGGASEAFTAGDVMIGRNGASMANILWDESAKQLKFRGGTSTEAYIDTNGSFNAGGGNVVLSSAGLVMTEPSTGGATASAKLQFKDSSANTLLTLGLGPFGGASQELTLSIPRIGSRSSSFTNHIDGASGTSAKVDFIIGLNGDTTHRVRMISDADNEIVLHSVGLSVVTSALHIDPVVAGPGNAWIEADLKVGGRLLINETTDANLTQGIVVNQGANDDFVMTFKSSDISHPFTAIAEVDTFGAFRKSNPTEGGLLVRGITENEIGVLIAGAYVNDDTGKATSANGAIELWGQKTNGSTSVSNAGTNANLVVIRDNGTTRFIFDAEGDAHNDGGGWTAYDDFDDVAVLNALDLTLDRRLRERDPLRVQTGEWLRENKALLQKARIVNFNDDTDGVPFINTTRLNMLLVGAVRQLAARLEALESAA